MRRSSDSRHWESLVIPDSLGITGIAPSIPAHYSRSGHVFSDSQTMVPAMVSSDSRGFPPIRGNRGRNRESTPIEDLPKGPRS